MAYDLEWSRIRNGYRDQAFRVLDGLYEGRADEADLNKLYNFVAVALMLMAKTNLPTWRKAEKEAELSAWLKLEMNDE